MNSSIMYKAFIENVNLAIEHLESKRYKPANLMIVSLLDQLHMLDEIVEYEVLLDKIVKLLKKFEMQIEKGRWKEEQIRALQTIFMSICFLSYKIYEEKGELTLEENGDIYMFHIGLTKYRWKEILENELWKDLSQIMIFQLGADEIKINRIADPGWIGSGVKKYLDEYIKQTIIGLFTFTAITRHPYTKRFQEHFVEMVRAGFGEKIT